MSSLLWPRISWAAGLARRIFPSPRDAIITPEEICSNNKPEREPLRRAVSGVRGIMVKIFSCFSPLVKGRPATREFRKDSRKISPGRNLRRESRGRRNPLF